MKKRFRSKYGYPLMLGSSQPVDAGLITNSIHSYANPNRFTETIARGTRDTVANSKEESRAIEDPIFVRKSGERTSPEGISTRQVNASGTTNRINSATTDCTEHKTARTAENQSSHRTHQPKAEKRVSDLASRQQRCCLPTTKTAAASQSGKVSQLVSGESAVRFETRSALVFTCSEF